MWCVGENPSHALLWPHKETVFRVRQCGDAWHVGVKLPVKPTETGMGHEQQHTWRVSLCFLTVSALSVCVGWRWRWTWWMCVCNCVFLETSWYRTASPLEPMVHHSWKLVSGCEHPQTHCPTPGQYHTCTRTHILHTDTVFCTHELSILWPPHMVSVLTLSFHCPKPEVIVNQWWMHL